MQATAETGLVWSQLETSEPVRPAIPLKPDVRADSG